MFYTNVHNQQVKHVIKTKSSSIMTRKLTVPKQFSYANHLPSIQENEDDINNHVLILQQDLS